MNIKICQNFTLWYYNLKNSFFPSESIVSLPLSSEPVNNILICLPESSEDFRVAKTQLPSLTDAFQFSTISLLLKTEYLRFASDIQNCQLITYSANEFDLRGLPKKSLWQKFVPQTFQITIDFNAEFRLPIAVLCRKINSPLRLTFAKPYDVLFFNVILQISNKKNYANKLDSLLHYLYAMVVAQTPLTSQTAIPLHKT